LMYADASFCDRVKDHVRREAGLPPEAVCVAASHSHSTPTAALARGAGEPDDEYVAWASRQAATAAIQAFNAARPATLSVGAVDLPGWTVNRTRPGGPVDDRLTVWRFDDDGRRPLAAVVNFAGHPTVQMALGAADVSRDYPGQVTDLLERELPGVTAVFLQGACGEINIKPECHDADRCHTAGVAIAQAALQAWRKAKPSEADGVGADLSVVEVPTRRWTRAEIDEVRAECARRLATGDGAGWLDGFAKAVVNVPARLPERYGGSTEAAVRAVARFGVEWSDEALKDFETRPEARPMRVQALRVGDGYLAANGAEFFSSHAVELRRRWGKGLIVAGYANESVGYLPDADDVRRRTYAAAQSPKFKGQLPFTEASGEAVVGAMLAALGRV
ncbi:MAG: hypothetical protein ACRC33_04510, partial [Gemmataceae bacterium]